MMQKTCTRILWSKFTKIHCTLFPHRHATKKYRCRSQARNLAHACTDAGHKDAREMRIISPSSRLGRAHSHARRNHSQTCRSSPILVHMYPRAEHTHAQFMQMISWPCTRSLVRMYRLTGDLNLSKRKRSVHVTYFRIPISHLRIFASLFLENANANV